MSDTRYCTMCHEEAAWEVFSVEDQEMRDLCQDHAAAYVKDFNAMHVFLPVRPIRQRLVVRSVKSK